MTAGWPPRWCTLTAPSRSRGQQAAEFIETFCRVTKESVGGHRGELMRLRPWQKKLLNALLATDCGRLVHRQALIGLPRKNGKSTLLAGLVLWQLVLGPAGGEIYSIAGDREQAGIVFDTVKEMVALEPELSALLRVQRDVVVNDSTGTVYRKRSSEAGLSEGYNPTFVVADEVHVMDRPAWDAMALGAGARPESLMVGITTAGVRTDRFGNDSLAYGLYQQGCKLATGEQVDRSFFFAWWEPVDRSADHRSPNTWRQANPGYGDLNSEADFASAVNRTPEPEFRTKRCNQWVSSSVAWLPAAAWEACQQDGEIPDGADVVVGFDGSRANDATAIVVVSVEATPRVEVVELWEKPADADGTWRVEVGPVEECLRSVCDKWNVMEIVADPSLWRGSLEKLESEGLPIVEFPQSPSRMIPATQRFFEAVTSKAVTHSGDPRLARHVANARVKQTSAGVQVQKEFKSSARKIDACVAAIMAFARASELSNSAGEPMIVSVAEEMRKMGPVRMAELVRDHDQWVADVQRRAREAALTR